MDMPELEKTTTEQSPASEPKIASGAGAGHDHATPSVAGRPIRSMLQKTAAQAFAIVVAIAFGWYVGAQWFSAGAAVNAAEPEWVRSATTLINKARQDVDSTADDVRRVRDTVATLSENLAEERGISDAKGDLIIRTLEGLTRATETLIAKLEHHDGLPEPGRRELPDEAPATGVREALPPASSSSQDYSSAESRRMATALAVLAGPAVEPKPVSKTPARLTGWVLRDVYNGNAVIETPERILHEVAPGKTLPGVGRIEALERNGKRWVVVTSKGVITHDGSP